MPTLQTKELPLYFFNEQVMTFIERQNFTDQELSEFLERVILILMSCLNKCHGTYKAEFLIEQMQKSIDLSRSFYEETETKQ